MVTGVTNRALAVLVGPERRFRFLAGSEVQLATNQGGIHVNNDRDSGWRE